LYRAVQQDEGCQIRHVLSTSIVSISVVVAFAVIRILPVVVAKLTVAISLIEKVLVIVIVVTVVLVIAVFTVIAVIVVSIVTILTVVTVVAVVRSRPVRCTVPLRDQRGIQTKWTTLHTSWS
jgi:hypothetical protein